MNQYEAMENDRNAGKAVCFWIVLILLSVAVSQPVLEPQPIEVKPVLKSNEYVWEIFGKPVARYQDVIMPGGIRVQLKAPDKNVSLSKAQWQKMADDMWKAKENEPKPKRCPNCGQLMP